MRQFIESLIVFQFATGRYSPVYKVKSKEVRTAIFVAFFAAFFAFQVFMVVNHKEKNLYEILGLESPYVSNHQIDVAFKTKVVDEGLELESEAYELVSKAQKCLKRSRCRDQYTRYNLAMDLPDDPNIEIDWRLGFTLIFYIMFAFTQSVLGSVEQKPGIRIAMGLGIMFCIDEILVLQDISLFITEGQKSDPSIQRILSFFPSSYCTFEVVLLARLLFFFLFNVICSISITYVVNETKERIAQGNRMLFQQQTLHVLMKEVYAQMSGKEAPTEAEIQKKEYVEVKGKMMKELAIGLAAIQQGKSKEELVKGRGQKTLLQKAKGAVGAALPLLLLARYLYTKYQKSESGAPEEEL